MMTKEQVFEEFNIAKEKDIAKSTSKPPYENVFTNRLNVLKSHKDAKKSHPRSYRHLDINFDNLILAYSAPVPVDHFYKTVFGKSLSQYTHDKRIEDLTEKQKEKEAAKKLKEKQDEKTVVSIN
tara:strand:- start:23756 stop:24127 length:372 start_codon:yes stop_codon:yes gene_type:complete